MAKQHDTLTLGTDPIGRLLTQYAIPAIIAMTASSLYNMADSIFIGQGVGALAISGLALTFPLMNLAAAFGSLVGVGASTLVAMKLGQKDYASANHVLGNVLVLNVILGLLFMAVFLVFLDPVLLFFGGSEQTIPYAKDYMRIILYGNVITHMYLGLNSVLRSSGFPRMAMYTTLLSVVVNCVLNPIFIFAWGWGIQGAAWATVIAQYISAAGLSLYVLAKCKEWLPKRADFRYNRGVMREILSLSWLTCAQQSVMNFGILMVQGLVNSFGAAVMAAFAAAVKIDAFAYMPVQDFGNAFSTFIAQNYGAGKQERIRKGLKGAVLVSVVFCVIASALVFVFAKPLMLLFVEAGETEIIAEGVRYLHIEGAFYCGIGCLFLLYGLYRAVAKPGMSVVLTVISLGTRVVLAYLLSAVIGVTGIW